MKKYPTVAIYSGVSKSTTFIERLISGLANQNIDIYIFGSNNGRFNKSKHVLYKTFNGKLHKLYILLKYSLCLFLFKSSNKKRLDVVIDSQGKRKLYLRLKYYPVLWYQPDIFHVQWAKGISDWMWVQEFGMKLVLSLRGTHITISPKTNPFWEESYLNFFPKLDGFHAVSESIAKEALKYGIKKQRITIVKSGIDVNELDFIEKTTLNSPLQIISVGRSHFAKGYKYALDSMLKLKQLGTHFQYTIIGVDQSEALIYQRSQLGLDNEVQFINSLPFKEVQSFIKQADVVLLSSVEEGIANVVLEAMALGTIVISTNCGGMEEVVVPGKTGFLIPKRDVHSLTKALVNVSQLKVEDYLQITKQARDFVEKNHNKDQMVTEMQLLYKHLITN